MTKRTCATVNIFTTEEWVTKAKNVHGDRYDYSKSKYTGMGQWVVVICSEHGEFKTTPHAHQIHGIGCLHCIEEARLSREEKTKSMYEKSFFDKAIVVHRNKYDYSLTEYRGVKSKVVIICREHGTFSQLAASHLEGKGCPSCSYNGGFNTMIPATLYYLRVESRNQLCYKIGITNRTVQERFERHDLDKITILSEQFYPSGIDAKEEETRILREHKAFKYSGEPILSSGNSELFTKDVLLLDNHDIAI